MSEYARWLLGLCARLAKPSTFLTEERRWTPLGLEGRVESVEGGTKEGRDCEGRAEGLRLRPRQGGTDEAAPLWETMGYWVLRGGFASTVCSLSPELEK